MGKIIAQLENSEKVLQLFDISMNS